MHDEVFGSGGNTNEEYDGATLVALSSHTTLAVVSVFPLDSVNFPFKAIAYKYPADPRSGLGSSCGFVVFTFDFWCLRT